MCSVCGTPPNTEARMPREYLQGGIPLLSPIHEVCSLQWPSPRFEQSLPSQNKNISGIPTALLYSSEDSPSSSSSSRLNIGGSQHRIHSLPQHSFSENVSFPTAPNASTPCYSSPSHQPNKIPKPNQKVFTQSFIISLNCAKSIQTTSYILQVAAKSPKLILYVSRNLD
jgi:hypothetical protein